MKLYLSIILFIYYNKNYNLCFEVDFIVFSLLFFFWFFFYIVVDQNETKRNKEENMYLDMMTIRWLYVVR